MKNTLNYNINDPLELNLSYMTFVKEGGLFIPTKATYSLGNLVQVNLRLPSKHDVLKFTGKVIWITPMNALYHAVPGVGVQFVGAEAKTIRKEIESCLDSTMELSGYTCGITDSKSSTSVD